MIAPTSHKSKDQRNRGIEGTLYRGVVNFSSKSQQKVKETDCTIYEHVEQLLQNVQAIEVPTRLSFFRHPTNSPRPKVAFEFTYDTVSIKIQCVVVFDNSPSLNAVPSRFEAVPRPDPHH